MPGLPAASRTYVLRFNSRKFEMPGTEGQPAGRTPRMKKGTMPIQALPLNVSTCNPCGRVTWTVPGGNGQWMNNR